MAKKEKETESVTEEAEAAAMSEVGNQSLKTGSIFYRSDGDPIAYHVKASAYIKEGYKGQHRFALDAVVVDPDGMDPSVRLAKLKIDLEIDHEKLQIEIDQVRTLAVLPDAVAAIEPFEYVQSPGTWLSDSIQYGRGAFVGFVEALRRFSH